MGNEVPGANMDRPVGDQTEENQTSEENGRLYWARQKFLARRRIGNSARLGREIDPPAFQQRDGAVAKLTAELLQEKHETLTDDVIADLIRIRKQFQDAIEVQVPSISPAPLVRGQDAPPPSQAQFMDYHNQWALCMDWRNANFMEANFAQTVIGGSDLSGADLRNADLRAADCRGCNFEGADLSYAQVSETTDFTGANITNAKLPADFHIVRGAHA